MSISKFSSCVRHVVVVTLAAVGLVSSASHAVGQSPCCDSEIGCDGLVGCDSFVEAGCDSCCGELSCREQWAESGITFSNNFTQFYFGTVAGGRDVTVPLFGWQFADRVEEYFARFLQVCGHGNIRFQLGPSPCSADLGHDSSGRKAKKRCNRKFGVIIN